MTEQEAKGEWWLPDSPSNKVAGTLVTTEGEFPTLELIGALEEQPSSENLFSPPIILGLAGSRPVTLYRCTRTNVNQQVSVMERPQPRMRTERYVAEIVLNGAHFPTRQSIVFPKVALELDALFEWASISGFRIDREKDAEGLTEYTARYRFPETPTFSVAGARISIVPTFRLSGGALASRVEMSQSVALEITPTAPIHIDEYLKRWVHDAANFVAFGVGSAVRTQGLVGTLAPKDEGKIQRAPEVDILFLGRDWHVRNERRHWEMLFTLAVIRDEAATAFERWFERVDALRPIHDLYFGTLFQKGGYVHQRFLSLAQALESYHRRVKNGQYLPEQVFNKVVDGLMGVINQTAAEVAKDVRQAFCTKLTYFNELSLRKRLKELVADHGPEIDLLIQDKNRFIKRVVATRNYYTHYEAASTMDVVPVERLHVLSDQMQFVLELCLLAELGLKGETIRNLVRRYSRYQWWAREFAVFDSSA